MRDVIDPIHALFEREWPDYAPWPWGRQPHVAVLVRHILLAEPMAEEFAARFRGVTPDAARSLARSFRLDACAERTGLTLLLAEHLRA